MKPDQLSIDELVFSKWMLLNPNQGIDPLFISSAEIQERLEGLFSYTVYEIAEMLHKNNYQIGVCPYTNQYKWVVFKP